MAAPPPSGVEGRAEGRRPLANAVLLLVTRTLSRVVVLVTVIVAQNALGIIDCKNSVAPASGELAGQ